jgi:phosphatidylinositol alpha-mannosyltransferase
VPAYPDARMSGLLTRPEPSAPSQTDSLRIDLMTPCFWPEVRRGTERFARELADGLLARGHRPRLITSHPGGLTRTVEDGLPIVRVPRPPDRRLRRRMIEEYITHLPFSYAALRMGDAQIAHAMHPPDAVAALRWKRRTGRPVVFSFMGVPNHDGMFERRRRLDFVLSALEGCDAVVVLSKAAQDAFTRWFGYDARLIAPGVALEDFSLGAERDEQPTIICSADVATARKRVPLVIEAFTAVRRERPDARLVLSRPRDPRLTAKLSGPGIEWADLDDRAALAAAYGRAWVSVLASFGEAFGLVLTEALATGTPVVATNTGGMVEIVDRPTVGRLFDDTGDAAGDLARALLETLELAEEPATRAACRVRAEAFSTDRTTDNYLDLYRELL